MGRGLRYRVRYTDPDGRERSRSFPDRDERAAEAFLVTVEADKLRGSYIDPQAGRISLRRYASEWLAAQTFDESTREATESRLRVHVYPYLGDRRLGAILPSHVQAWDRALQQQNVAPTYRRVLFANLSAIFSAAVDDERIAKNPCRAAPVRPPGLLARKVTPWPAEHVLAVHQALPARYRSRCRGRRPTAGRRDRSAAAIQPRTQRPGPPALQRLRLEGRACRDWDRTIPRQRHARAAALLRLGAAGCG